MTQLSSASTTLPHSSVSRTCDVLLVGPWHEQEFALAIADWSGHPLLPTADEAEQYLAEIDLAPELICIACPQPGTVDQRQVDQLQSLAPLARIVVVAGTWCEGELRTGNPPGGVIRLYWYEFAPWWRSAQRKLADGVCPTWSLPLDHMQAGRLSADGEPPSLTTTVAIDAPDPAVFETLAESVRLAGGTAIRTGRSQAPAADAGIWDGGQLSERELVRLHEFCSAIAGAVVVLLDFPRSEHVSLARRSGATTVLGKPYVVEELIAALRS